MLTILKKLSSRVHFKNKWWTYKIDEYTFPDASSGEYHYVTTSGSTMVIPVLDNNKFIMTKQFRYLMQKESLEFPGGGIKTGLEAQQNALEELEEEAGYRTESIYEIGSFNPFNGVTDEICKVYLADNLIACKPKPEASEEFEILTLNYNEITNKIKTGEIWDGMSLAAWSIYLTTRAKL